MFRAISSHVGSRNFAAGSICWLLVGILLASAGGCGIASSSLNADGTRSFQQGNTAGAIRNFEEAIAANPRDPDSYYNLATVFHQLAKSGTNDAYWGQAETYYNQCLDFEPNHAECYRGLAVLLVEQNRQPQAIRLLEGWKDRNPFAADPKTELARLHQEFGDTKAAEQNLVNALALDPTNARARTALGKIREDQGDLQQALTDYNVALSRNPRNAQLQQRVAALSTTVNPVAVLPATAPPVVVTAPPNTIRY